MSVIQFPTKTHKRKEAKERKLREIEERKLRIKKFIEENNAKIKAMKEAPKWSDTEKLLLIKDITKLTSSYDSRIPRIIWDDDNYPTTLCTITSVYERIAGSAVNCIEFASDNIIERVLHIHGICNLTHEAKMKLAFPDGCAYCAGNKAVHIYNNYKWQVSNSGTHVKIYPMGTRCKRCQAYYEYYSVTKDFINNYPTTDKIIKVTNFIKNIK